MGKDYLTEKSLGIYLNKIFPNHEFINSKKVPNSEINFRPDYRQDDLKLIIEFDGPSHYTQSSVIIKDLIKDNKYSSLGYKIIRIPYFIQMSKEVIKNLFNVNFDIEQIYKHGFIDEKVVLPADYCYKGLVRFEEDLDRFYYIKEDIINSLRGKVDKLGNIDLVLPYPMHDLISHFI